MKLPEVTKDQTATPVKKVAASIALFSIGLGFILLCVYFLFGQMAFESFDVGSAYQQILTGRLDSQRVSAVQWVQNLQKEEVSGTLDGLKLLRPTEAQSRSLWSRFIELEARTEAPGDHEKSLRAALPTLVSYSQSPAQSAELIGAYVQKLSVDRDAELQVYLLLALRRTLDASHAKSDSLLIESLGERLKSADPDLKSAAAFTLSAVEEVNNYGPLSQRLQEDLRALLLDQNPLVRLNGALALCHLGDSAGLEQLRRALAGAQQQTVVDLESMRLIMNALKKTGDVEASKIIKEMAQNHTNLKLRQLAKEFSF